MFIVIDGPDGTGKSTLAKLLAQSLQNATYTAEPTDSPTGKRIRQLLKTADGGGSAVLPLFLQDRQEHIETYILPALRKGQDVVCDRYKYSTVGYQWLQGANLRFLVEKNRAFLSPDVAFLLNTYDVGLLLSRIHGRGQVRDAFESAHTLRAVCRLYRRMPMLFPNERFVFLPAELATGQALERCLDEIKALR